MQWTSVIEASVGNGLGSNLSRWALPAQTKFGLKSPLSAVAGAFWIQAVFFLVKG
jgi:hypothetical protein